MNHNDTEYVSEQSQKSENFTPEKWPRFEIVFKYRSSRYEILIDNPLGVSCGVAHAELDGSALPPDLQTRIPLVDDGSIHSVRLILGDPAHRTTEP